MGYDLYRNDDVFYFNFWDWHAVLALAHAHGWEPEGTLPPPDLYNEGPGRDTSSRQYGPAGYVYNEHRVVAPSDSSALAEAVEKALPEIPDWEPSHKLEQVEAGDLLDVVMPVKSLSPVEQFADRRDRLRDFVAFCRRGYFCLG